MKKAMSIAMIWIMGILTIIVMKKASLLEGLSKGDMSLILIKNFRGG